MKNQKNMKVFELMETTTGKTYGIYLDEDHAVFDAKRASNSSGLRFVDIFPLHVHERYRTIEYVITNIVDVVVD